MSHTPAKTEEVKPTCEGGLAPANGSAALPIPDALYPCLQCSEEFSWPAKDLFWSERCKAWVCDMCWDCDEHGGEQGTSLANEIKRQNDKLTGPDPK